jgi:hypothetical protein
LRQVPPLVGSEGPSPNKARITAWACDRGTKQRGKPVTSIEPTSNGQRPEDVEVAVVGAGQAGLAIGYFLAQQGRRFVLGVLTRAQIPQPRVTARR